MKVNEEIEVKIEKIADSGIARYDGLVIFVEDSCPEDILRAKITKVTKNYAQVKIVEIIEPSPYRVKPFCPMHNICGACSLQYIDYDYQLQCKKVIVEDALKGLDIVVEDVCLQ